MLQSLLLLTLAGGAIASPAPLHKRSGKTIGIKTVWNGASERPKAGGSDVFAAVDDTLAESLIDATSDEQSIYYLVDLEIGTPAQKFQVLLDTGSTKTVVWTDECDAAMCNTDTAKLKTDASSTFKWTTKDAKVKYGGGQEYTGKWATDTVTLGEDTFTNYGFQAITASNKEGVKITYGSGVLGLGWTFRDGSDPSRSLTQLIADKADDKRFGVYLDRNDEDKYGKSPTTNSELTIEGIDESKIDGEIALANVVLDDDGVPANWWIKAEGLKFGDKAMTLPPLSNNYVLVDSGTPGIGIPTGLQTQFFDNIPGSYKQENGVWIHPCNATGLNMTITLAGVEWPIYWGDLVRPLDDTAKWCRSVVTGPIQDLNSEDGWVVGATFMKNVYSVFSYANPPQVGLAKLKDEFNTRTNRVPRLDGKYPAGSTPTSSNTTTPSASPSAKTSSNDTSPDHSIETNDNSSSSNSSSTNGGSSGTTSGGESKDSNSTGNSKADPSGGANGTTSSAGADKKPDSAATPRAYVKGIRALLVVAAGSFLVL